MRTGEDDQPRFRWHWAVAAACLVGLWVRWMATPAQHAPAMGPQMVNARGGSLPATSPMSGGVGTPAEPAFAEPGADDGATLPFSIANIRRDHAYFPDPPYVRPGGNWTFFDCTARNDPRAVFTVGVQMSGRSSSFVNWGRVVLFVPDRDAGSHFAAAFAKGFHADVPSPLSPQPLRPVELNIAVLGQDLDSTLSSGKPGGWTATKWFVAEQGTDAEVFFNYTLTSGQGRFAEKDSDYRTDLVSFIAENFRDGVRPRRTSAVDPTISESGPQMQSLGLVPESSGCTAAFLAHGEWLSVSPTGKGGTLRLVRAQDPTHPVLIGTFDGDVRAFAIDPKCQRLVVDEHLASEPHVYSSSDKHRIWLIDHGTGARSELTGGWGPNGSVESVSDDGRLVAIGRSGPHAATYFYDVNEHMAVASNETGSVVGWRGAGTDTAAFVRTYGISGDKWSAVNTKDGAVRPMGESELPVRLQTGGSPDGRVRFVLNGSRDMEIRSTADSVVGRFTFHEDDRRYATPDHLQWLDSRFVLFAGRYPAVIDLQRLKMSYLPDQFADGRHEFSRDFRWFWEEVENGIRTGRVIVPAAE